MNEENDGPPPLVSVKKKITSEQNSKKMTDSNTIKKQSELSNVKVSAFNISNPLEKETVKKKSKIVSEN